jgi:hypothetical protein
MPLFLHEKAFLINKMLAMGYFFFYYLTPDWWLDKN